jgi:hypothetical protein
MPLTASTLVVLSFVEGTQLASHNSQRGRQVLLSSYYVLSYANTATAKPEAK